MICTRGKQITPLKESGVYFICQFGEYKNRQCKWVKWCKQEKQYESRTDDTGYLCENFTTEIFVEKELVKPEIEIKVEKPIIAEIKTIVELEPEKPTAAKIEEIVEPKFVVPENKFAKKIEPIIKSSVIEEKIIDDDKLSKYKPKLTEIKKPSSESSYFSQHKKEE